jgi:hypothetical protein
MGMIHLGGYDLLLGSHWRCSKDLTKLFWNTKQGVRVDVPGSWPAELSTRDHITFNGRVWQGGLYDAGKRENEVDRLTISCPNVLLAWFIVRMQVRTGKSQTPRGVALTLTRADGAWVI